MKILSYLKHHLVLPFLIIGTLSYAQETAAPPIDGGGGEETYTFAIYSDKSTTLMPGTTAKYWVHDGTVGTWDVTGGSKISQNDTEVTVKWGTGSSGTVIATGYLNGGTASGTKSITIIQPPNRPPSPSQVEGCNGQLKHFVQHNGTPPANVRWYWQKNGQTKSTSEGYSASKSVKPDENYYLQAYNTETQLWSDKSIYGVTVERYYPDISSFIGANICVGNSATLELSADAAYWDQKQIKAEWFDANTNTTINKFGRTATVGGGSYYATIKTKDPWICTIKSPTVQVYVVSDPTADPGQISGGGNYCSLDEFMTNGRHIQSVTPASVSGGTLVGYEWHMSRNGGAFELISGHTNEDLYVPASHLPADASESLEFIRKVVYTNSCSNTLKRSTPPLTFNVYDRPVVATATVDNQCGQSIISMPQPSGMFTYYWQTSATGTETTDTRNPITVLETDTRKQYYLRARHNLTLCWNLDSNTKMITAAPKHIPEAGITYTETVCYNKTARLTAETHVFNYVYWTDESGKDLGSENPLITPKLKSGQTFNLKTVSGEGCENTSSAYVDVYQPYYFEPDAPTVKKINNTQYQLLPYNLRSDFAYYWLDQGAGMGAQDRTVDQPGIYVLKALNSDGCDAGSTAVEIYDLQPHLGKTITNPNYVRTFTYLKENVTDANDIAQVAVNTQYLDGLGRTIQEVDKQATPQKTDLVAPREYDASGNMPRAYLPYRSSANDGNVKTQPYAEQHDFYNAASPTAVADSYYPFAYTEIERAPTQRAKVQHAPGESWTGEAGTISNKGIHNKRMSNVAREVLLWQIENESPVYKDTNGANTYYAENTLFKEVTTDEQKHQVIEYTDKEGKTILKKVQTHENGETEKWADTYYIYDDFGNLRFVLPPMASKKVNEGNNLNTELLAQWAFQYQYDARKRMITKKVPGADWEYIVYDVRDRLVLTQDGAQRAAGKNEWTFTKYDQLDRPVLTGITDMGTKTTGQLRNEVAAMSVLYEQRGTVVHGYTNNTYPSVPESNAYLTVTYYDDYSFLNLAEFSEEFDHRTSSFDRVKNLVTGSKIKDTDPKSPWILTATYYDNKYRETMSVTKSEDLLSNQTTTYDFAGRVLLTSSYYSKGQTESLRIDRRYEYDHAGRLLRGYHKLTKDDVEQEEVLLAENKYNELGEQIEKNLHIENGTPHQSIDYRYNIRGWLQSLNNSTLQEETGVNVDDPTPDLFGMDLLYNNPLNGVSVEN
ncbi:hypothetical protein JMN32_08925 [Fulvivirga sp. 29W222]|uniref:DUF6443 domain-containing protein n=2 Tax=Fulvivirga marina TaxID=2494733 RepID=A0A937FUS4_9BACT|nr:hypothetical protein [Fulvivirga marina]